MKRARVISFSLVVILFLLPSLLTQKYPDVASGVSLVILSASPVLFWMFDISALLRRRASLQSADSAMKPMLVLTFVCLCMYVALETFLAVAIYVAVRCATQILEGNLAIVIAIVSVAYCFALLASMLLAKLLSLKASSSWSAVLVFLALTAPVTAGVMLAVLKAPEAVWLSAWFYSEGLGQLVLNETSRSLATITTAPSAFSAE